MEHEKTQHYKNIIETHLTCCLNVAAKLWPHNFTPKVDAWQFCPAPCQKAACSHVKTGTKLLYHEVSPLWTYWAGNWNLRPQRQIRFLKNEYCWSNILALQSAFVPFCTNIPTKKNLRLKELNHKLILNFQIQGNNKIISIVIAVESTFHRNFARLLHPASYLI